VTEGELVEIEVRTAGVVEAFDLDRARTAKIFGVPSDAIGPVTFQEELVRRSVPALVAEVRRLHRRIRDRHDTADGKTCGYCARPWPCPDRLEVGTCSPGRGNLSRPGPGCLLA
jgi:hypothetical protein